MSIAVSVEGVSKTYRLGTISSSTLGEDLVRGWARLRGKPDPMHKLAEGPHARQIGSLFWALEDISFSVKEGHTIGVIGRNGAGKSTLFKVLSQVTAPTTGRIAIRGRVASLLEVGTGFHPELTGRENVYLNGAILGMTRAEVRRNFDEIVAFSECESFIDTPVKRYSSGMYVRLAFAVAAHLQSEILIVDEVLAVGDAQFQEKCLGKMRAVSSDGRTVLFVSHSMASVAALCSEAILLSGGRVAAQGSVRDVAEAYQRQGGAIRNGADLTTAARAGSGQVQFAAMHILPADVTEKPGSQIVTGSNVNVDFDVISHTSLSGVTVSLQVYDAAGYRVMDASTGVHGAFLSIKAGQRAQVRFRLMDLRLKPGSYRVDIMLSRGAELVDHVQFAGQMEVVERVEQGRIVDQYHQSHGVYRCRFTEEIELVA